MSMTTEDDPGALTASVVDRMGAMFAPYRGTWDRESLISEGLDHAQEAIDTYDPTKGAARSTWICTVVWRRLHTKHRSAWRERNRERAHGEMAHYLRQGRAFEDVDETLPIAEYAGAIYRQAILTLGKRHKGRAANGGDEAMTPAQEAAMLAIKRRLKLSPEALISFLGERGDVVRSIRLKHLPSYRKIYRLVDRLATTSANNRHGRTKRAMAKKKERSAYICESDAALLLGISPITLRGWRVAGKMPDGSPFPFTVYRPGGVIRYLRAQVEAWMEAQATPPAVGVK